MCVAPVHSLLKCPYCCGPQAAQNIDGDGTGLGGDLSSLVQSLQGVDAPTLSLSPVRSILRPHGEGGNLASCHLSCLLEVLHVRMRVFRRMAAASGLTGPSADPVRQG